VPRDYWSTDYSHQAGSERTSRPSMPRSIDCFRRWNLISTQTWSAKCTEPFDASPGSLRYLERVSRVGTAPKATVDELYSLIEMLNDYYSVDWKSLCQAIGVSNNSIDRIKRLANRPELHPRHTNAADPHQSISRSWTGSSKMGTLLSRSASKSGPEHQGQCLVWRSAATVLRATKDPLRPLLS
jgi:hypothetical protein